MYQAFIKTYKRVTIRHVSLITGLSLYPWLLLLSDDTLSPMGTKTCDIKWVLFSTKSIEKSQLVVLIRLW